MNTIDLATLSTITGGAQPAGVDTLGPTVLVAGRPMTCQAVVARGKELFAHANDESISNATWLREYRRLDDAYMRFPKAC